MSYHVNQSRFDSVGSMPDDKICDQSKIKSINVEHFSTQNEQMSLKLDLVVIVIKSSNVDLVKIFDRK